MSACIIHSVHCHNHTSYGVGVLLTRSQGFLRAKVRAESQFFETLESESHKKDGLRIPALIIVSCHYESSFDERGTTINPQTKAFNLHRRSARRLPKSTATITISYCRITNYMLH